MHQIDNPMRRLVLLFLLLSLFPLIVIGRDAVQQQRIDYLIQSLSSLNGAVFVRNGNEYVAPAARDHLQRKLNFAGERVKTAEEFIKYCATESSITHQPYKIRFADGTLTETASYFREKLKEFDQRKR
jgi:hypothetical protein